MPAGKHPGLTVRESEPFNAETPGELLARDAITPVDAFYVRGHGSVPELDAAGFGLTVDGLVGRRLELGLPDLRERFGPRTVVAALSCAGNRRAELMAVRDLPGEIPWGDGAVGCAAWTGVALSEVLAAAAVEDRAEHVAFLGADAVEGGEGFGGSIPLEKATSAEVLLAWAMNGAPLEPLHGAPLRAVVPGYWGARSVKWLSRVTVQAMPSGNHFHATDYRLVPPDLRPGPGVGFPLGELSVNAGISLPADGAHVPPGVTEVQGWALAGGSRSVARVDVSPDGGRSWSQAELGEDQGRWAWRRWHATLELAPGEVELVARAWDSAANVQPEQPAAFWNPRGYANAASPRARLTVQG